MNDKRKYVQMSRVQIIAAGRLLDEHSVEAGDKRHYAAGWDDDRIAQVVSANDEYKLNVDHIRNLRREIYPNWASPTLSKGATGTLIERITALETRVQALEDAATAPRPNGARTSATWAGQNGSTI